MADSNITKRALASAFKDLMEELSFDKITIGKICGKCEMNRKSFYYHFRDKYDLVNWIYCTEFITKTNEKQYKNGFDFLLDICKYFEVNKKFYRKILKYDGQNSFSENFLNFLTPYVQKYTNDILVNCENTDFLVTFFSETFANAIKKWMFSSENIPAEKFCSLIRSFICATAKKVVNNIS